MKLLTDVTNYIKSNVVSNKEEYDKILTSLSNIVQKSLDTVRNSFINIIKTKLDNLQ